MAAGAHGQHKEARGARGRDWHFQVCYDSELFEGPGQGFDGSYVFVNYQIIELIGNLG